MRRTAKVTGSIALLAILSSYGCKKERTCNCKTESESTTETVARTSGTITKTTGTSAGETSVSRTGQTRRNAEKAFNCHNRTATSVYTYTSQNTNGIADVTQTNVTKYTCELK